MIHFVHFSKEKLSFTIILDKEWIRCNFPTLKVTEEIYDRNISNIKKKQIIKVKEELKNNNKK